jgi:ATP-dependent helicase/nuclease subunit A
MTGADPGFAQGRASDPARSVWVSANAGSGKTKVLTDRVTRLLIAGTDPASILCLTYTKAAAAEMQNRLFRQLGEWAMLPDAALAGALAKLGAAGASDQARLAAARRLFAQALETPGGLRIQTIHAFCAALLRRFPLEAGVSPQFTELDDRSARLVRLAALDEVAEGDGRAAAERLAAIWTGGDIDRLLGEIAGDRDALAVPMQAAALRRRLGVAAGESLERILAETFTGGEAELIAEVIAHCAQGSVNDRKLADALDRLDFGHPTEALLRGCEGPFLYGADTQAPFAAKRDRVPTQATQAAMGALLGPLHDLMQRVEAARRRRVPLAVAEKSAVLHDFAAAFLAAFARHKAAHGWLDFDDLILTARRLLLSPGVAPWVLWRLDGGIAHLLVDEAQDTSPAQWAVIEALTDEFIAAPAAGRTVFVVGDGKQSIYSFQGADLSVYDATRARLSRRLAALGTPLLEVPLLHSFRSAPALLRVVDCVFPDDKEAGRHLAFFDAMPGRVEVLAPVIRPEPQKAGGAPDLADTVIEDAPEETLAALVAERLRAMLAAGTHIPLRKAEGGSRAMAPGDILILLRKRSRVFGAVIRALKAAGLPVAGADRLALREELAVRDILATLNMLALPEDDLSLAAALRSPLFGWTEGQLYALAQGRSGPLWDRLRAAGGEAADILTDLRDRADFLRPHDLISRLLVRHGGRQRLLTRLGVEAEDAIDALLAEALAYERGRVPSLTGFLAWMEGEGVEVKRQMDEPGGLIRVMTVHGAKGLEAPVVILPDCGPWRGNDSAVTLALDDGTVLWRPAADEMPEALAAARRTRQAADRAEQERLLYVAMTRAESWLIVTGIGPMARKEGSDQPEPWYTRIRRGLELAGGTSAPGGGVILEGGAWPAAAGEAQAGPGGAAPLPAWMLAPAATPQRPPQPVSPSDLGGAKALPGEGEETEAAKARGTALHRLLELLPGKPRETWLDWAAAADADAVLLEEAAAVLSQPSLAEIFGPGTMAEVPVTAAWNGRMLLGSIDRLVVSSDRVLAVDFKSNRMVPDRPEGVPEGLLRQMGAYAHVLEQIYPGRRVETAILWTRGPRMMPLPDEMVRAALLRATTP